MTGFPEGSVVSLPPGLGVGGEGNIDLRFDGEAPDAATVRKEIGRHGPRLRAVEADGRLLVEEILRELEGKRLIMHAGVPDIGRALPLRLLLERLHVSWVIHEAGAEGMMRCLSAFAGLGTELRIPSRPWPGLAAVSADAVIIAVDYYIHNPTLSRPIRPFHDILVSFVARQRRDGARQRRDGARQRRDGARQRRDGAEGHRDLWDIEGSLPGRDFFVAGDGGVELRTGLRRIALGRLADGEDALNDAARHFDAASRTARLLASRSACAFCGHLPLCGGWFEDGAGATACEAWKPAFELLRSEFRRGLREIGERDAC